MKACSYCGHLNDDAAKDCVACGTAFPVPEPVDPTLTDPAESLVILKTFDDVPAATLLKDKLEQAGIEACIPEEVGSTAFSVVQPLGRVTVRVARKDLQAAKEILGADR